MNVPFTTSVQHEDRVEEISEEYCGSVDAALGHDVDNATAIKRLSGATANADNSSSARPGKLKPPDSEAHLPGRLPRKAASADSIRSPRGSTPQAASSGDALPSPNASINHGASSNRPHGQTLSSPPSSMSLSGLFKVTRKRALSTHVTDYDTSAQEESDFDRGSASARSKGHVRSRLLSLRSTKTSSSVPETLQPLPSSTNFSHNGRSDVNSSLARDISQTHAASEATKRSRSHSVGNANASSASRLVKRLSIGNRTPKPDITREVTIGVLGPSNCGKSTFIRKSLKRKQLSNEEPIISVIGNGSSARDIHLSRRLARLTSEFNTEVLLTVYEVDTTDWISSVSEAMGCVWPSGLPPLDGVFICYDISIAESFASVIHLLDGFQDSNIVTMVIACKVDLEKRIDSEAAARVVQKYAKIVETSQYTDNGKSRMRKAMDVLVRQINSDKAKGGDSAAVEVPIKTKERVPILSVKTQLQPVDTDLTSPTSLPTQSSTMSVHRFPSYPTLSSPATSVAAKDKPPTKSAARTRSLNDLLSERHGTETLLPAAYDIESDQNKGNHLDMTATAPEPSLDARQQSATPRDSVTPRASSQAFLSGPIVIPKKERPPPVSPYWTLEELLNKLFFVAITGDDNSFVKHFLLTYRRFTSPRCLLLGMQKRMNEWRLKSSDTSLACFAQLRLCSMLEYWIEKYPSDFAVAGTHGALHAFIKQLLFHPHTLSYGSDFKRFLDMLPDQVDEEAAWAFQGDDFSIEENDRDMDSLFDADPVPIDTETEEEVSTPTSSVQLRHHITEPSISPRSTKTRERRSSLPLTAIALIRNSSWLQRADERSGISEKDLLSKLQKVAVNFLQCDAIKVADEITHRDLDLFLKIRCRDFLRNVFVPGGKDPNTSTIARFNNSFNDLHEWAVSIILCHDKPKARARSIGKLVEVCQALRQLNNYSSLRAIITAITQATYATDAEMEIFKKEAAQYKTFLSCHLLFLTSGSHQSYRMALKNTAGPCIPSLEVHLSDLHRADSANSDFKPDEPNKINWAKFNMMGRFIGTVTDLQQRCIGPLGYILQREERFSKLLDVPVMDYEMQQRRISQSSIDDKPSDTPNFQSSAVNSTSQGEKSSIRKILPW